MVSKLILTVILLFSLNINIFSQEEIVMGYVEFYPITFTNDSGEPDGFMVDLFNEIYSFMDADITYESGSLPYVIEGMRTNEIDFFPFFLKTPERLENFSYLPTPTFTSWSEFFVLKYDPVFEITDIDGQDIGYVKNDANYYNFLNFIDDFNIRPNMIEYESYDLLSEAVSNNELFGVVSNKLFIYRQEDVNPGDVHQTGIVFSPSTAYVATSNNNENIDILSEADSLLNDFIRDGRYDYLYRKWIRVKTETPTYIYWIISILVSSIIAFIIFTRILKKKVSQQTKDIKQSRDKYERLFNLSQFAIIIFEYESGKIVECNDRAVTIFGAGDKKSLIGLRTHVDLSPEFQSPKERSEEKACEILKKVGDKIIEFEWAHKNLDGKTFWTGVHISRFKENFYITSIMDISYIKQYQKELEETIKEKDVLLNEIHHRVKNNLGIVSSMLQLQLGDVSSLEEATNAISNSVMRIKSIAEAHTNLYENNSFSGVAAKEYFEKLVDDGLVQFQPENVVFNSEINPITIPVHQAIPLGIILNEFVSNSIKHSFNGQGGKITIKFYRNNGDHVLVYEDDGDSLSKGFRIENESSFGFQMIQILVEQLKGDISFKKSGNKSIFTLEFSREEYF